MRSFQQVDVFTSTPLKGNPVAVVLDASNLSTSSMQQFANWTNLSETTFVLPPTDPTSTADYRVRIFTPDVELPFAGHPTLGTCHAWLKSGGIPKNKSEETSGERVIVQECGVGLVTLRQSSQGRLFFAAPPLIKGGLPTDDELKPVCKVLGLNRGDIVDAQWCDNGPGWIAVMLSSVEEVLALKPNFDAEESYGIGIVGKYPLGVVALKKSNKNTELCEGETDGQAADVDIEVRAFFRAGGQAQEDPVTGSLNAAVAQWLLGNGTLLSPYVSSQGTALGRAGRVYVEQVDDTIWVGGDVVTVVSGSAEL